jgi:deoxyribonuclease V
VRVETPAVWPSAVEEAVEIQERLRSQVDPTFHGPEPLTAIAGFEVAYAGESDRLVAAVAVLDARTAELVDHSVVVGKARFPYIPGLFAFREVRLW